MLQMLLMDCQEQSAMDELIKIFMSSVSCRHIRMMVIFNSCLSTVELLQCLASPYGFFMHFLVSEAILLKGKQNLVHVHFSNVLFFFLSHTN